MRLFSKHTTIIVGFFISGLLLYLALKDIEWSKAYTTLLGVNGSLVLLGTSTFILAYIAKWFRWHYLLSHISRSISYRISQPPFFIGFLVNNILPLRAGEIVRLVMLARKTKLSKTAVASTVVLDRILDGLALLSLLGLAMVSRDLPGWIVELFAFAVVVFVGALIALYALHFFSRDNIRFEQGLKKVKLGVLGPITNNIKSATNIIRKKNDLAVLIALSISVWCCEALMYWFFAKAFGFPLSYLDAIVVLAVVNFGIMIPSSPGYVGTFQFLCVKALSLFGIAASAAIVYSVLIHIVQYVLLSLAGAGFLIQEGLSLQSLKALSLRQDES